MLAVTFKNISGLAEVSDYEYEVIIGGGDYVKVLDAGYVRGHKRSDGWEALVKRFLERRESQDEGV